MRILNVGLSEGAICGVRDYAAGLTAELRSMGHQVETAWHSTSEPTSQVSSWLAGTLEGARDAGTDVIVWQYSVFTYSTRGIPTLAIPFARQLQRAGIPVVTVLHEFAYPWHRNGWRGMAWAVTQRCALGTVLRASSGLVVTVEDRAAWLNRRPWLPHRPTLIAPVFSNLPESFVPSTAGGDQFRVGIFSYPLIAIPVAIPALARLRLAVPGAELWLLGGPGPESTLAHTWQRAAAEAGMAHAIRFTGVLGGEELAREIAKCDVCLYHDGDGPSSRKGSLAAVLALGKPVLAVDGPKTWPELAREHAVELVSSQPGPVGDALLQLAANDDARRELGYRARSFYLRHQSRPAVAHTIEGFLHDRLPA